MYIVHAIEVYSDMSRVQALLGSAHADSTCFSARWQEKYETLSLSLSANCK